MIHRKLSEEEDEIITKFAKFKFGGAKRSARKKLIEFVMYEWYRENETQINEIFTQPLQEDLHEDNIEEIVLNLVKAGNKTFYVPISGQGIYFPPQFAGKHVRLKVEIIDTEEGFK